MDQYTSILAVMDPSQWVLAAKLFALAVLLALGLWRIRKRRQGYGDGQPAGGEPDFDMRRDGQRFNAEPRAALRSSVPAPASDVSPEAGAPPCGNATGANRRG